MSAGTPASPPQHDTKRKPRRFAPLDPSAQHGQESPRVKGIIFDMDGTLCLPQNYMFKEMRAALGIPRSVDILDHIRALPNEPDEHETATQPSGDEPPHSTVNPSEPPSEEILSHSTADPDPVPSSPQARAVAKIRGIERRAMTSQRPQPGLQELMAYLTRRGIRKALCTRNFPTPVHHLLDTHLPGEHFEPIITRETEGVEPKPSPEGLWTIAQAWGLEREYDHDLEALDSLANSEQLDPLELAKLVWGSGLIMVGDSIDDMAAGRRAGAATVLLVNDENEHLVEHEYTGLTIRRLDELIVILENGFVESK
ncbi:hypothetical protein A1O3_02876 [Capronia epimyces CBS 606.96]|uniref:HAD superfamily hydrolase n=1 Tax=Capronia epimyces CBS 606.96 TaxID=1182542 RepID=W9Z5M8_9EURO|nr:uncharacterized protein A1O3_02876 [Capronia epimyces CBS 606.96]EXJ89809.1 hypothetical protein A1O3_02876 [Capronia epimyces CBS 606.96]